MSYCVNTKNKEYKELLANFEQEDSIIVEFQTKRFMDENEGRYPSYIELKTQMARNSAIELDEVYTQARQIVRSLLPGLSEGQLNEKLKFVDKLELIRLRGGKEVLSSFINNTIYLSKDIVEQRGLTDAVKDIKHEVFHMIFNNFLTNKEQVEIIDSFRKYFPEFKNLTDIETIEELMAEQFELFRSNPKSFPQKIREFFQSILEFFGIMSKKGMDINDLFNRIHAGQFTRNDAKDSFVVRDKTIINKHAEFRDNVDLFVKSKNYLLNYLNRLMYPENYDDISKEEYPILFLDSELAGDKNIDTISKIGLTKEEAISYISRKIKITNTEFLSEEEAQIVNALKKETLFKDLFEYIQPYTDIHGITKEGQVMLEENKTSVNPENLADPSDEFVEDTFNLNQEIQDKSVIDPKTKVSESVKDFLSSIFYKKGNNDYTNVDSGTAFVALLKLFSGIHNNPTIESILKKLNNNFDNTNKGNQLTAIYSKLVDLLHAIENKNTIVVDLSTTTKSKEDAKNLMDRLNKLGIKTEMSFSAKKLSITIPEDIFIDDEFTNKYDSKIHFIVNNQKTNGKRFKITKDPSKLTVTFLKQVEKETGIPAFIVAHMYKVNQNEDTLRSLMRVANSFRDANPKFVKVDTVTHNIEDDKIVNTRYIYLGKEGEYKDSSSMTNDLLNGLNIPETRKKVIDAINKYTEAKKKNPKNANINFLQELLVKNLNIMGFSDYSKMRDSFKNYIVNKLKTIINTENFEDIENIQDLEKYERLRRHVSELSRKIKGVIHESNVITSYKTAGSNKLKWLQRMKNFNFVVLNNLRDFRENGNFDSLLPVFQNAHKNYLRFNPLLDIQIGSDKFGINTESLLIDDKEFFADNEEMFFTNNTGTYSRLPITFSKESRKDWYSRNLLATFFNSILEAQNESSENEKYKLFYWQQKYQPESAPNVSMIKMSILKHNEVRDRVRKMIIQEAFLNQQFSGKDISNLSDNSKESILPGLTGTDSSKYFLNKDNENIFFHTDGNIRPRFVKVSGNKSVITEDDAFLEGLIDKVINDLSKSSERFTTQLIESNVRLTGSQMMAIHNKLKQHYSKENKLSKEELEILESTQVTEKGPNRLSEEQRKVLTKFLSVYYNNQYVNAYFLNQLTSGVTQNYKSFLDEVKRQAGVNAMHETGLVTSIPNVGMRPTYKIAVTQDPQVFVPSNSPLAKRFKFFSNKLMDIADAQSFAIPEFFREVRRSHGKDANEGSAIKNTAFEVDKDGKVYYHKTHTSELTNEMCKMFPERKDIRYKLTFSQYLDSLTEDKRAEIKPRIDYLFDKLVNEGKLPLNEEMEYRDIINDIIKGDHLVGILAFKTSIKGISPKKLSTFTKNTETSLNEFSLHPESILVMDSNHMGIQQNPRKRAVDTFLSHFTQLTYIIGLNGTESSIKNNKIITNYLGKLSKSGLHDFIFEIRAEFDENFNRLNINRYTRSKIKKLLTKKLDLPGNERLMNLLNTPQISLNNPLYAEKLIQTINNTLTKETVKPKHPGGKFVLQSEFGTSDGKTLKPSIVYDNKTGLPLYAECYLPEMYSQQLNSGDMLYYNNDEYNRMFGFRIPSSDLHSSVPLKVKGFYPSNSEDNIAIIPAEIINIHGADFDVDSLFVVRPGVYAGKEDSDNLSQNNDQNELVGVNKGTEYRTRFQSKNITVAQKGIKFGFTVKDATYNDTNTLTSFGNNIHLEIANLEEILLDEKQKTHKEILKLEKEKDKITHDKSMMGKLQAKRAKISIGKSIDELTKHLETIKSIQKGVYSNKILAAVLDTIDYAGDNIEDSFTGISFDVAKGFDENSIYSQMADVYSQQSEDKIPERPVQYTSLNEIPKDKTYDKAADFFTAQGYDLESTEGKEALLDYLNNLIQEDWSKKRDKYLMNKLGKGGLDINKVDHHADIHQDTYMAASLVGIVANFSKAVSYLFHSISDKNKDNTVKLAEVAQVKLNGKSYDALTRTDDNGAKNQEFRSFALNAAIDHVKEQILNIINVGEKTIKIFMTAASMEIDHLTTTWLMLQPVAKELSRDLNIKTLTDLNRMEKELLAKLKELSPDFTEEQIDNVDLNTENLKQNITKNYLDILESGTKEDVTYQLAVIKQLKVLNMTGD